MTRNRRQQIHHFSFLSVSLYCSKQEWGEIERVDGGEEREKLFFKQFFVFFFGRPKSKRLSLKYESYPDTVCSLSKTYIFAKTIFLLKNSVLKTLTIYLI